MEAASDDQQGRPKSYRIISSQPSNDGTSSTEPALVMEPRSTPSPPRLDNLVMEPPPPPPYPYEMDAAAMENKIAQSYSLSTLPSSSSSSFGRNGSTSINECLQQQPPIRRVHRTSADGLPNYEQALQYKVELGRQMATSTPLDQSPAANVPWFHTSTARRWPTVSGIHPAVLDQLVSAIGARRLQQAQSEPGLAGPCYTSADEYGLNRRCCQDLGRPMGSYAPSSFACSPYAAGDPFLDGGGAGAYRSISSYQLTNGMGRACTCQHHCGLPPAPLHPHPHHHLHAPYAQYGNGHQVPTCTPNGLYVKQPRAQLRSATVSAGHRMHAADCQQSASQLLYTGNQNHGTGSNKAVARVHSMYEAAKADHVRRSLEYEYYRRFEQQVVQNTRRELRKQQMQLERQLAASMSDSNGLVNVAPAPAPAAPPAPAPPASQEPTVAPPTLENGDVHVHSESAESDRHRAPGHYCESCQETHTAGKIDLAQLKDIIRAQNVDLPLMRALCNDQTFNQQQESQPTPPDDSAAHPLLRQKKHSPPGARSKKPPTEVAPFEHLPAQNNGRPVTWHESIGSSSWPPYEFAYDH